MFGTATKDEGALDEEEDHIEHGDIGESVCGDENGAPWGHEFSKEFHHLAFQVWVESCCGFIQEQKGGVV